MSSETTSEQPPARPYYASGVPATIDIPQSTIDEYLAQAAQRYPDRIATDFLGRTRTYSELFEETRRAMTVLYDAGVRKGDTVAVLLPSIPQHVVAFFAILGLGAVVAEHNPLAPTAELESELERHSARVVIAWEKTIEQLVADGNVHSRTYFSVDVARALPLRSRLLLRLPIKAARTQRAQLKGTIPPGALSWDDAVSLAQPFVRDVDAQQPSMDDTAVLVHTSGTTGVPKAAELTHSNLGANAEQTRQWLVSLKDGEETIAGVLPFFHAFGLLALIVSVKIAGTILLLPKFDVPALLAAHRRHPITLFPGVAPMFDRFLKGAAQMRDAGKPVDLTSITYAFSGAMALDPRIAAEWEKATHGLIIEGYGMTEASPIISGSPLSAERRPSTLGIPFPSTEVKLVDPDDPTHEVAPGEIGEIIVHGPQVFKGYLGMPDETREVLLPGRWLRTGDIARMDRGFLVMADRRKEVIINGGFNIYPSQVEDAIKTMPGIRDVAVVGMPESERGESVVAALVLEPGSMVDLDAVRRWTQDKLSHYAMPKSIAILDELPHSMIGKVVRRNVKEQLQNFELKSGEWKRKAADFADAHSDHIDSLRQAMAATVSSAGEKLAEMKTLVSEPKRRHSEQRTEENSQGSARNAHDESQEDGREINQPSGTQSHSPRRTLNEETSLHTQHIDDASSPDEAD
ncbi:MAG: AMP-binding protein [Actinomycetaceae bacterium]|nr:AMP-binding protein [Actinomycetaceae bacterium]MDY6083023.1 AMP-binding protein [Actinomycetaceae bacterium]